MPYTLNSKLRGLKPYDPISGDYKIRLDANESFLPATNALASKILEAAAFLPYNRYPDPLATEVCRSFARFYNVEVENVTAGNGSDELISIIYNAFLMKGDTVMTVSPDFSMYKFYSSIVEAKSIEYQKKDDLTIDVDELIRYANRYRVKMILFSNPCNPTSLGLKRAEVRKLITSVSALVVLDEAYMDFWDQSLLDEYDQYDNLIILRTCSKAIGMAAIRLGFAVANSTLTNALKAVKSPYNVNALTQRIGSIVLNQQELLRKNLNEILISRGELYQGMKALEEKFSDQMYVYPSVTNFVLIKMPRARVIYEALLSCGIAVRFMGDYLRITAGSKDENFEVLTNLEEILKKY